MRRRERVTRAAAAAAAAMLVAAWPGERVRGDTFTGGSGWKVEFTEEERMESNFKTSDLDEAVSGLQPGDSIVFTVGLENGHPTGTDWYMTNKVLYSLEDRSANAGTKGGAYTYRLSYTSAAGEETVLFDSETVGGDSVGEAGEGLHEATDALEDYFYLDTLKQGDRGEVELMVALEGETQGNDYQDTLADLQMNFAVELNPAGTTPGPDEERTTAGTHAVKTGDENLPLAWLAAMAASGALLMGAGLWLWRRNRKKNGNGKALSLLLAACAGMLAALAWPAEKAAAAEPYDYEIRVFAGSQGTVGGGEVAEFHDVKDGDRLTYRGGNVYLESGGASYAVASSNEKYYVIGIRESGKDNNEVAATYEVTADRDYVVAYGIRGSSVAYTVAYEDEAGNELAPEETYYGNVGDKPVVAYLYIEGYQPQAYNLGKTLSENEAENVFTFIYSPVEAGETPGEEPGEEPGEAGEGTEEGAGEAGEGEGGEEAGAGPGPGTLDDGTELPDEGTPLGGPEEYRDLDDEETPLGQPDIGGRTREEGATAVSLPTAVRISVGAAALAVLVVGLWLLLYWRKKDRREEEAE